MINTPCLICRRTRSGAEDEYGDPVMDEEMIETVGEFQQRSREELPEGQTSEARWAGYFFPETVLETDDAIFDLEAEEMYELDGAPWTVRNSRTGEAEHVEATLIKVARLSSGATS